MKKRIRKLISILSIIVLLAAMLAGCGSESGSSSKSSKSTAASGESTTADAESETQTSKSASSSSVAFQTTWSPFTFTLDGVEMAFPCNANYIFSKGFTLSCVTDGDIVPLNDGDVKEYDGLVYLDNRNNNSAIYMSFNTNGANEYGKVPFDATARFDIYAIDVKDSEMLKGADVRINGKLVREMTMDDFISIFGEPSRKQINESPVISVMDYYVYDKSGNRVGDYMFEIAFEKNKATYLGLYY